MVSAYQFLISNYYESQVIQGLLMVEPKSIADTQQFLRLWTHEASRVFRDRHALTPYTLTLHPAPHPLHPAPCTLHPAPFTLHPASRSIDLQPHTKSYTAKTKA